MIGTRQGEMNTDDLMSIILDSSRRDCRIDATGQGREHSHDRRRADADARTGA
jgi:hypothetical protein